MNTPIVLIIFNRPHTTKRVVTEIVKAEPSLQLVVADGPLPDQPDDAEKCAAARVIIERVDWQCEVIRKLSSLKTTVDLIQRFSGFVKSYWKNIMIITELLQSAQTL